MELIKIEEHRGKPDAEMAKEIREAARPLLEQLCEVMNTARTHGLNVGFNIVTNAFGKAIVQELTVVKML